jgi:hypothetical protein
MIVSAKFLVDRLRGLDFQGFGLFWDVVRSAMAVSTSAYLSMLPCNQRSTARMVALKEAFSLIR